MGLVEFTACNGCRIMLAANNIVYLHDMQDGTSSICDANGRFNFTKTPYAEAVDKWSRALAAPDGTIIR